MSECPIGLICEHFECDRAYCQNLANPCPLPWYINPGWRTDVNLLVSIPTYDWECPNVEHLIIENERYNAWVEAVRFAMWLGGWWDAIPLPYEYHPDGGMLVISDLPLDEYASLACPWDFHEYQRYRTHWDGFMPPVPIDGYEEVYGVSATVDYESGRFESDGFFKYQILEAEFFERYE